ncbi:Cytoplasmic tRNA 2-thiolation protein 2 [Linnemannia schmuckeri]|uniref:Cytoplasmic tRNA 2-thiolation protein 2 n=1 Tax=Linnemannia schmuckeri TaxID=64567 RepID=A0A9P5RZR4_9FUNG|nr:Cytoplasmic tRNA 2-thiolation protein 2 [Linnemannia schmuckeri]
MSCSVEEPTMTVAEKRAKDRAVHAGFCCKCKTAKSTITVRYAEYCDPCFLIALDSKFRTALRNARPYRVITPENMMLAFSGGPSSRALIHLFDVFHSLPPEVATNKKQPKIYNDIHVCHIDESCLLEPAQDQDSQEDTSSGSTMGQARSIAEGYGYSFHGVAIEDIYDPEWTDSRCFEAVATLITSLPKDQLTTSGQAPELLSRIIPASATNAHKEEGSRLSRQEKINKLKALLGACTTLTAKETVLQHFRSSLLIQLAKRGQCTILALGDSATRVAIQIIELTSIGRGYSLPHETSLLSSWVQDCKVIRPLKDCLVKELDTFCGLNGLELIEHHHAQLDWTMKTKAEIKSIRRLTDEFITGLDKEFPSTVATVCRTAAKLTPPEATYDQKCPLCLGPMQAGVQEWKRRITVTTAPGELDTTTAPSSSNSAETEVNETSNGCCSTGAGGCCSSSSQQPSCATRQTTTATSSSTPFSSLLCYGCLTNLRDLDLKSMVSQEDNNNESSPSFELPPYVAETIVHRMGFASLNEFEHRSGAGVLASGTAVDPQESLRAQIQEFLIASDDEDE